MKKHSKRLDYLHISPASVGMDRYPRCFNNYHSRWIHASWLLLEDLNKSVTYDNIEYTIYGMFDNEDSAIIIMLKPIVRGPFRLVSSKKVAHALGHTKMRNLATGATRLYGVEDVATKAHVAVMPFAEEEDTEESPAESINDDQVYRDMLSDVIDEGDNSAY